MAFILAAADGSYLWPVSVPVPIDGGRFDSFTFDARFKRLSQDRIEELTTAALKRVKQLQAGEEPEGGASDRIIAEELLIGWAKVQDDAGAEVPYSESAKDQLLQFPGAAAAIVLAWYDSINGKKAKN